MATGLVTFQSFGVTASSSGSRKPTAPSRKTQSSTGWMAPIFGWSADPDYFESSNSNNNFISRGGGGERSNDAVEKMDDRINARSSRFAAGTFTEEKARHLRLMTTGLEMSHEKMYHSAIASRLASDFPDRFDELL